MTLRVPAIVAASAAALALAASATASTPKATRYIVEPPGFSIILPSTWYPIPRTVTAIKQTIARYKAAHNTSVAGAYGEVIDSASGRSELAKYRFQAFLWPPLKSVVPTEVSVQVVTGKHLTSADLTDAGDTYAESFEGSGSSVREPQRVKLTAGPCELVEATVSNGHGVSTGAALYLFIHRGSLYVVSFEIDGTFLRETGYSNAIRELANTFSFSTS